MFVISLAIVVSISVILVAVPKSSDAEIRQKIADEETRVCDAQTAAEAAACSVLLWLVISATCDCYDCRRMCSLFCARAACVRFQPPSGRRSTRPSVHSAHRLALWQTYNRPGVGRIVIFVLIGVTCFFAPLIATVQQAVRCPKTDSLAHSAARTFLRPKHALVRTRSALCTALRAMRRAAPGLEAWLLASLCRPCVYILALSTSTPATKQAS